MNCRHSEHLQSYSRDHTLSKADQAALTMHMIQCAVCRHREEQYRKLVANLSVLAAVDPSADLLGRAATSLETQTSGRSRLPSYADLLMSLLRRKETRIMLMRSIATAAVIILSTGTTLVGTRQQQAHGQTTLPNIKIAVAKTKTAHVSAWITWANSPVEAQYDEWHEGKTPVRSERWAKNDALRTWSAAAGPALLTSRGCLVYDRQAGKVQWQPTERTFTEIREDNIDPLATLKNPPVPGMYRRVTMLEETQRRGHRVRALQVESGPEKPAVNQSVEAPALQQDPAKTPPLEAASRLAKPERWTYWVDKATNLPVCREHTIQIARVYAADGKLLGRKWIQVDRMDYDFNVPVPKGWFDASAVEKEAEAFFAANHKLPQP